MGRFVLPCCPFSSRLASANGQNLIQLLNNLSQRSLQQIFRICLQLIDNEEFHSLILEDASSVRNRQQTDSIPVVDDIRFHLFKGVLPNVTSDEDGDGQFDSERKLTLFNDLLVHLGIEC